MRTDLVTVYLIHFAERYRHAGHYIGVAKGDVDKRLRQHQRGRGARLMQVVKDAGIAWRVAQIWEKVPWGTERRLKARGGASRICPICKGQLVGVIAASGRCRTSTDIETSEKDKTTKKSGYRMPGRGGKGEGSASRFAGLAPPR